MRTSSNPATQYNSDVKLVRRARAGDADAFAALFHAHKTKVYSICLRMTSNTAEAEDLTQDTFLQVFRKLATFRGDSALSTWLYRVAVNTVLMHFRRRGLQHVSLDPSGDEETHAVKREYGRQDDRLSGSVDRIAVARALRELPNGYRRIFLLHEIAGYEHSEIARLLRCSVGNSKSQLHKAKARIRELLGYIDTKDGTVTAKRTAAEGCAALPDSTLTDAAGDGQPLLPIRSVSPPLAGTLR